jgi:hypothetical protein
MNKHINAILFAVIAFLQVQSAQAVVMRQLHEDFASGAVFNGTLSFSDNFDTLLEVSGILSGGGYSTDVFSWIWMVGSGLNPTASDWDWNPNTFEDWLVDGTPGNSTHSIGISWVFPVVGQNPVLALSPASDILYAGIDGADAVIAYGFGSSTVPESNVLALLAMGLGILVGFRRLGTPPESRITKASTP